MQAVSGVRDRSGVVTEAFQGVVMRVAEVKSLPEELAVGVVPVQEAHLARKRAPRVAMAVEEIEGTASGEKRMVAQAEMLAAGAKAAGREG